MQTCLIEVNGKKQTVTFEQLQMLVSRGVIKLEAAAWVGGKVHRVGDLLRQIEVTPVPEIAEEGDNWPVVDDLSDRFSRKKSHSAVPFYLGMLAVVLFAILGVASVLSTSKSGVDPSEIDVAKNESEPANTEPTPSDVVPVQEESQEEGQRESRRRGRRDVPAYDEDESDPEDVFRFKASDELFGDENDPLDGLDDVLGGAPSNARETETKDNAKEAETNTDFDGWLEEQRSAASGKSEPAYSASGQYGSEPFDGDISKLPVDYLGHDLAQVVVNLQRYEFLLPTSSQSPTSSENDEFFQRQAQILRTEPLYGSLLFGSRLAYAMKNVSEAENNEESIKVEYDPSRQTMIARRSFKFSHAYSSVKKLDDDSKRRAKNYRVYFTLLVRNYHAYGLAFDYSGSKSVDSAIDHWTLTNVPADVYEKLKDSLRVLCVFQLGAKGSSYSGFRGPISGDFRYPFYALSAEKLEFWLYDGATGAVLAKYPQDSFLKGWSQWLSEENAKVWRDPMPDSEPDQIPKRTWRDVLREAVEPEESWSTKTPAITIPDDAASLEEALTKAHDGDVILVRASEKPIPLRSKKAANRDSSEVLCEREVAVVGESKDATIEIPSGTTLKIDLPGFVAFKGVTFVSVPSESRNSAAPAVVFSGKATGRFRDCRFVGAKRPDSTGVAVVGEHAAAEFWRCKFSEFETDGLRVEDSANATLEYCEFISGNRHGLSALSSSTVKVDRCRFDGNVTGFVAEGGGGVVASNSFFSGNRSNWSVSSGSARASDTKNGNVVEK